LKYYGTMAPLSVSCNQNCGMSPLLPPIKCGLPIPYILVALLSALQLLPFLSLTSRKEQMDGQIDCVRNETTFAIRTEFRTVFLAMLSFCMYSVRSTTVMLLTIKEGILLNM
jgi:hypothetical protein